MQRVFISIAIICFFALVAPAQSAPQALADAENSFHQMLLTSEKEAFLKFLNKDGILFEPAAVNGTEYWRITKDPGMTVTRVRRYMDLAASGLLGYTTGSWNSKPRPGAQGRERYGEYVTVWERRSGGDFRISLDITIEHDAPTSDDLVNSYVTPSEIHGDPNPRRWSAADPSMNFFKLSMTKKALGGAYDHWAGPDIRLLIEGEFPIEGKKNAVKATKDFISIDYPKKTALLESTDMAYIWNPCEYANSDEGKEKGNCLHIWKLRDKKYYIVVGVLSRVRNLVKPKLNSPDKKRK